MAKNYFAILGVASSASPEEIRSAFRRLAKEFHPDYFEGGSRPFREIQEAYSILGNASRRRTYERSLTKSPRIKPAGGGIGFYECYRCAGEGAISGEMPIAVSFPSGLNTNHAVVVPLGRLGIRNLHLTVLFRLTETD